MPKLTLVTGNQGKLAEWQRLLPSNYELTNVELDLPEIQSLDSKEIVTDKVKRAFASIKRPVVVEDVTAGLTELNGLPGPFIKYFEVRLGKEALYKLVRNDPSVTITCTVGYYDGHRLIFGQGELQGQAVAARGRAGFGFDFVFQPDGHSETFAEMPRAIKDAISHRHLAIDDLLKQLKKL